MINDTDSDDYNECHNPNGVDEDDSNGLLMIIMIMMLTVRLFGSLYEACLLSHTAVDSSRSKFIKQDISNILYKIHCS